MDAVKGSTLLFEQKAAMESKTRRPFRIAYLHRGTSKLQLGYMGPAVEYLRELAARGEFVFEVQERRSEKTATVGPSIEVLREAGYDGLLAGAIDSDAYFHDLEALNLPIVALDHAPLARKTDSVTFDGIQGGALAARVLVERGHREILFVSRFDIDLMTPKSSDPTIEDPTSVERRTGIQEELAKHADVNFWPALPHQSAPHSHKHLRRDLLNDLDRLITHLGKTPTAMVCHDVRMCYEVAALLAKKGLKVPEDISLIGFRAATGGSDPVIMERPISHVFYSTRDMAKCGWQLLHERLTAKDGRAAPCKKLKIPGAFADLGSVRDVR
jgi:DNA-binding LacI/PurR family transcriptional regulator